LRRSQRQPRPESGEQHERGRSGRGVQVIPTLDPSMMAMLAVAELVTSEADDRSRPAQSVDHLDRSAPRRNDRA